MEAAIANSLLACAPWSEETCRMPTTQYKWKMRSLVPLWRARAMAIILSFVCSVIASCSMHPHDRGGSSPATRRATRAAEPQFTPLFPNQSPLNDWSVRFWSDIAKPAPHSAWGLRDGILQCTQDRGSWAVHQAEY